MRRDSSDPKWLELKEIVKKRDKGQCQLLSKLSPQEFLLLTKQAGSRANILDPAHCFGAGSFPHLVYDKDNVVLLNRYSHDMLDYFKNPISGKPIDREEHTRWWKRIIGEQRYENLLIKSTSTGD